MTKKKMDRAASIVLFCFAAAFLWYTKTKIEVSSAYISYGIGPQTIPSILGWTVLLLSIGLFIETLKKDGETETVAIDKNELITTLVFVAAFGVYIILMPVIGFYVTTALFLIGIFFFLKVNIKVIVLLVPCVLVAIYAIFTIACEVYLPSGMLI